MPAKQIIEKIVGADGLTLTDSYQNANSNHNTLRGIDGSGNPIFVQAGTNVTISGGLISSTGGGGSGLVPDYESITATGSNQSGAAPVGVFNFLRIDAGTPGGLRLTGSLPDNTLVAIDNNHTNIAKIYPQTGNQIDALGTNNPYLLNPGDSADFITSTIPAIFDPAATGADITLSGATATSTITSANESTFVNTSAAPGSLKYIEFVYQTGDGVGGYPFFGAANGNNSTFFNAHVGATSQGFGIEPAGGSSVNGVTAVVSTPPFVVGDVIGIAIDLVNGHAWVSINGVYPGGGDPATDTNPTFTGLTGTWYPGVSFWNSAGGQSAIVKSTLATFTTPPPTGFTPFNSNQWFSFAPSASGSTEIYESLTSNSTPTPIGDFNFVNVTANTSGPYTNDSIILTPWEFNKVIVVNNIIGQADYINTGDQLQILPASGEQFDVLGIDVAYTLGPGDTVFFKGSDVPGQWYSYGRTFNAIGDALTVASLTSLSFITAAGDLTAGTGQPGTNFSAINSGLGTEVRGYNFTAASTGTGQYFSIIAGNSFGSTIWDENFNLYVQGPNSFAPANGNGGIYYDGSGLQQMISTTLGGFTNVDPTPNDQAGAIAGNYALGLTGGNSVGSMFEYDDITVSGSVFLNTAILAYNPGDMTGVRTQQVMAKNSAGGLLYIFPNSGGQIDSLGVDQPLILTDKDIYILIGTGDIWISLYLGNTGSQTNALLALHGQGVGGVPAIVAGAGAGTSPTVTITANSTNTEGVISIVSGALPSAASVIATITLADAFAFPNKIVPVITPGNAAAALLSGATAVFAAGSSTTQWVIDSGTTGLTGATTYLFNYHVRGN